MKVLYISNGYFADCDFPLVKELQMKGIDVRYYIRYPKGVENASILEFRKPLTKWGILKASSLSDMEGYKNCVDLNRLYFISGYTRHWYDVKAWLLWIYVFIHLIVQRADVCHITWQLGRYERFILKLPFIKKRVMTVHDPIQHSGTKNFAINEISRKRCFQWADEFVLLNKQQIDIFCKEYGVEKERVKLSHLGAYDSILHLDVPDSSIKQPYILFFGSINPNKGVEYLTEAMVNLHERHPNVKLLIAGKGDIYFDIERYENSDYIIWKNRFIGIKELVSYVRGSLFCVCPYKDATQSGVIQTAFTLNTPVIATSVGNMPDVVKDGKYGLIVPPRDVDALAAAICKMIENENLLGVMKQNIKSDFLNAMSWSPIADDYIKVYKG